MSLKDLATKFTEVKTKMMAEGQEALKVEFAKVFEAYPEITVIKWNQYTPYFNDGDTCTFGVHEFAISNAANAEDVTHYGDYDGDNDDEWVGNLYGEMGQKYPLIYELDRFCSTEIGEEILLMTFGDHQIVTVTRDGMEVEEYEHD